MCEEKLNSHSLGGFDVLVVASCFTFSLRRLVPLILYYNLCLHLFVLVWFYFCFVVSEAIILSKYTLTGIFIGYNFGVLLLFRTIIKAAIKM